MATNEQESTIKEESFYEEDIISKTMRWPSFGVKCLKEEMLKGTIKSPAMTFISAVSQDGVVPEENTLAEEHHSTDSDSSNFDDAALEVKANTELCSHGLKSILKGSEKQISPSSPINSYAENVQLKVHFASPVAFVKLIEENSEGDSDTLILTPDQAEENDNSSSYDNIEAEDQKVPVEPQGSDNYCDSLETLPKRFRYDPQTPHGKEITTSGVISKQIPLFCFPKPMETKSFSISLLHSENKEPEEFTPDHSNLEMDNCAVPQRREYNHCSCEYPNETDACGVNELATIAREQICDRLGVAKPERSSSDAKSESIGDVIPTENISATPDDDNQLSDQDRAFQNLNDQASTIEIRNGSQEPNLQVVPCITRPTNITCCNPFGVDEDSVETTMCTSVRNFLTTAVIEECWMEKDTAGACSSSFPCDCVPYASEYLHSDMPFYSDKENVNEQSKSEKLEVFTCSPVEKLCDSVKEDDCSYETPCNDDVKDILEGRFDSQISINSEPMKELLSPLAHDLHKGMLDYNDDKVDDCKISLEVFTCSPAERICNSDLICDVIVISDHSLDSQISIESEQLQTLNETVVSVENADILVESEKLEVLTCSPAEKQCLSEIDLVYGIPGNVDELEKIFDSQISIDSALLSGEVIDATLTDVVDEISEATCDKSTDASVTKDTDLIKQKKHLYCSFGNISPINSGSLFSRVKVKHEQLEISTNHKANAAEPKTQDKENYENAEPSQREVSSNELNFFKILNLCTKQKQANEDVDTDEGRPAASSNLYLDNCRTTKIAPLDSRDFSDDKIKSNPVYKTSEAEETSCVVMNEPDNQDEAENKGEKVTKCHTVNSKTCMESHDSNRSQNETSSCSQPVEPLVRISVCDFRCEDNEDGLKMRCGDDTSCSSFDEKYKSGDSDPCNECSINSQINPVVQSEGGIQQGKDFHAEKMESATDMERKVTTYMSELPLKLKIDISELDGPDLLEAAMLLVQDALKKTKVKKPEGNETKMDEQSNTSPVFSWKNKFQYESQQLAMVETKNTDDKFSEMGSYGSDSPAVTTNCTRPLRLGLSRKHKVKRLHPYWDKRRIKPQVQANTISVRHQREFSET